MLAKLQEQINHHQLIVQARLDGYDIRVCPADGDVYILIPAGATVAKGLPDDDLFEHPATIGQGCTDLEAPFVDLRESQIWENESLLKKVLETLEHEALVRSQKSAPSK